MYNNLLQNKYTYDYEDEDDILNYFPVRPKNKYGFIALKNPDYQVEKGEGYFSYVDEREYVYRKPTPNERKEIVVNTIIQLKERPFVIKTLANYLAVSERTIQSLLKQLQNEKLIEVIPRYNENGARKSNAYRYVGPSCEFYGSGLNLRILYNPKRNVGIRHWPWKSQIFAHNKIWHDMYKLCKIKFDSRVARGKYLLKRNLPLVVPEKINYLVLRYSYWKGANSHSYRDTQYSKDGTVKIPLNTQEKTKIVKLFEFTFELTFGGNKDNSEITITDYNTKEQLAVFTWFTENVIQKVVHIDKKNQIQFFILGDFTVK